MLVSRFRFIADLQLAGLTPSQAIKLVRSVFYCDLGEAKELVTSHPAWRRYVDHADLPHSELLSDAYDGL